MANPTPTPSQIRMGDGHRLKIANSNILNCLLEHVEGNREMSATQVSAALGLLKKVLPDLASVQHSQDPENPWTPIAIIERQIIGKPE